ncbi:hypothetical protein [Amorphus orientalis]|uniref:Uncharacterized protein n=1 Tax=Amorphus orientalis TaxID=649198 RepID=A0AAE3VTZ7_9HYPH|nr:hypothetical protein [Amorphus orientalis]MDQ0317763.1 hypothetical protein [Amorphus orientalis]
MTDIRIPVSAVAEVEGEPRIRDLDLADRLQWSRPREIRTLIARNLAELELHGGICCTTQQNTGRRGRPGKSYYLNEGQALVIAALSRTDRAAQIRKAIVDVFIAYRRGQLVEVKAHRRRKPEREPVNLDTAYLETFDETRKFLSRFADQPAALVDVLAGCVARIEALERALEAA